MRGYKKKDISLMGKLLCNFKNTLYSVIHARTGKRFFESRPYFTKIIFGKFQTNQGNFTKVIGQLFQTEFSFDKIDSLSLLGGSESGFFEIGCFGIGFSVDGIPDGFIDIILDNFDSGHLTAHVSDGIGDVFTAFDIDDIVAFTPDDFGRDIEFGDFGDNFLQVIGEFLVRHDKFKVIFFFGRGDAAADKECPTQKISHTFIVVDIGTVDTEIGLIGGMTEKTVDFPTVIGIGHAEGIDIFFTAPSCQPDIHIDDGFGERGEHLRKRTCSGMAFG